MNTKNLSIRLLFEFLGVAIFMYLIINIPACDYGPCYRNLGTHTTNAVKVDQLRLANDTVSVNGNLIIRLWDTVGTNNAYTFKGIQIYRVQNTVDLTVQNAYDLNCGTTPKDTLLIMTDYRVTVAPPFPAGDNYVSIHQPDGTTLVKSFFAR